MNLNDELMMLGLKRLEKWIPRKAEEMLSLYQEYEKQHGSSFYSVSHEKNLDFCVFSWPCLYNDGGDEKKFDLEAEWCLEQIVLLVFDQKKQIIADMAAVHCSTEDFLMRQDLYDVISDDSDWSYLSYYTLHGTMFEDLEFPFCTAEQEIQTFIRKEHPALFEGQVLIHNNSYVTKSFRRRGIFRAMTKVMQDHALRLCRKDTVLYSSFALDPDVACYGPDTQKEPYIYSFEKDEPDRLRNAEILKKFGYVPLRLEEDNPDPEGDGTKLWFAVRKQYNVFLD